MPGGTAAYPSSVLMNAVPAKVAGVPRLVMVVPAPDGKLNPLVLAAARLAGVDEIYRIGGAQAVAALAYGTATIAPVDKIVGPGNAYVAAAKRLVFGKVGIDMIAGPSEVLILAGSSANSDWIAADLLAQAEHDAAAQSILITDDAALAARVEAAVEAQLATLPRAEVARASWREFGAVILVPDLAGAVPLVDAIAPEHLEIVADDAEGLAARIRNTGAIFLGAHTPEAIGDYVAGSNHVLPTARSARFSSGLGVLDFMKRTSILKCGSEQLVLLGPAAMGAWRGRRACRPCPLGRNPAQPVMKRSRLRATVFRPSPAPGGTIEHRTCAPGREGATALDTILLPWWPAAAHFAYSHERDVRRGDVPAAARMMRQQTCDLDQSARMRAPHYLLMWEDIFGAPFDQDLELAVIDHDGPHALVFPCRRMLGGWTDAETGRQIDVRPTHWRPWRQGS